MSEEFAVYSTFRNASAVDSEIFLSFSRRVIMNYSWYYFFSYAALAYDEHAEVCWCHLKSDIKHTIQHIAIPHDIVSLFYGL